MTRESFRLVFAQSADAISFAVFYLFIGAGVHAEQNPLVLGLMALGGIQLVAFVKIGVAAIVAHRHDRQDRVLSVRYLRTRTVMMSIATASGIVGAGFNSAAIINSIP